MSGNEQLERELADFLAEENSRVAALYRNLPRQEPDAALDASVLAMAREALAPSRSRRWLPAFSAAATLLIVVGIGYRVTAQRGSERAPSSVPAASDLQITPAAPVPASPALQESEKPMTIRSAVNTAKPSAASTGAAATDALSRQKTATAHRAEPPSPSRDVVVPSPTAAATMEEKSLDKSSTPPVAPAQAVPLQSPDATIFAPKDLPKSNANAPSEAHADVNAERTQPTPESMPTTIGQTDAAPTTPAPAPAAAFAPAPTAMNVTPVNGLYPEHWIADIRTLLRDHRRGEALRSLDAFRKQYPDYPLPDDLRDVK